MTDTVNTPQLVLPILSTPDLYRPGTAEAVARICTPFEEAKPGDILGVCYDWKVHRSGVNGYPITQVLRMTDDAPTYHPQIIGFASLPEKQQEAIALSCMQLQCSGLNPIAVEFLGSRLDPDSGEDFYFNFLLMPGLALLYADNPLEEVFENRYCGEELSQDAVDEAFILLIPQASDSNHQLIELTPRLQPTCDLINALFPIMDDEGETPVPLTLPDLTPLLRGELAAKA